MEKNGENFFTWIVSSGATQRSREQRRCIGGRRWRLTHGGWTQRCNMDSGRKRWMLNAISCRGNWILIILPWILVGILMMLWRRRSVVLLRHRRMTTVILRRVKLLRCGGILIELRRSGSPVVISHRWGIDWWIDGLKLGILLRGKLMTPVHVQLGRHTRGEMFHRTLEAFFRVQIIFQRGPAGFGGGWWCGRGGGEGGSTEIVAKPRALDRAIRAVDVGRRGWRDHFGLGLTQWRLLVELVEFRGDFGKVFLQVPVKIHALGDLLVEMVVGRDSVVKRCQHVFPSIIHDHLHFSAEEKCFKLKRKKST